MFAIGDEVENKIAYMKGQIDDPIITRILEINEYDEKNYQKRGEKLMRLKDEAYSERLESFATSTLRLLCDVQNISKKKAYQASDITTNSELTEEEVVRRLKELLVS